MLRTSCAAMVCMVGLIVTSTATGQSDDLRAVVLKDVPAKWKEYKVRAAKLQGQAKLMTTQLQPRQVKLERTDNFRQSEGSAVYIHGETKIVEGEYPVPFPPTVWAQNPKYSFELKRNAGANVWMISALEMGDKPLPFLMQLKQPVTRFVLSQVTTHFSGGLLRPLAELLGEKDFTLKKVAEIQLRGKKTSSHRL